ncbi:hypothetical protein CVV38_03985 [Candidatus Peregrinibacteria bacterium HGW-Peregrinibacteria-1]|jgi:GNAT superfamily N-acetyltransferase|nr:MAG: hypothetical protein CVV38_03985 [Candidatus Peregrinibacteria bacterium HGW-Peregrinibacteria-1]
MAIAGKQALHRSKTWDQRQILWHIIKNSTNQDPLPIFTNSQCYYLKNKQLLSYCVISQHKTFYHLKDVYTFPEYRRQGFAGQLISQSIKTLKKPIYLLCKTALIPFYQKLGFQKTPQFPFSIKWKKIFGDVALYLSSRETYHVMVKSQ